MPFEPLKYIDESGFPRKVKELLNDCAQRINRAIEIKFNTESLDPIAKVLQDEYKITFLLPRGALGSTNGAQGPWALVPGADGKVKVVGNAPLRYSQTLDDIVTIVNVGNDFTPSVGKLLFLQVDYDISLGINTVTLKMDDPWVTYSLPIITTGSVMTFDLRVTTAFYLIGKCLTTTDTTGLTLDGPIITLGDGSQVKVARCCYAPLLFDWTNMGSGFIIPFPQPPSIPGPPA